MAQIESGYYHASIGLIPSTIKHAGLAIGIHGWNLRTFCKTVYDLYGVPACARKGPIRCLGAIRRVP
jgi:hypothetical protein